MLIKARHGGTYLLFQLIRRWRQEDGKFEMNPDKGNGDTLSQK
jgi:hypothetical protein